jgi:hypothetical protein
LNDWLSFSSGKPSSIYLIGSFLRDVVKIAGFGRDILIALLLGLAYFGKQNSIRLIGVMQE